jgi:N-acetyl-anhydromuramyl-L-alanine amidase AmpD
MRQNIVHKLHLHIRSLSLSLALITGLALSVVPTASAITSAQMQQQRLNQFAAASKEFGVPLQVLLSTSYNLTRWEDHDGQPSVSGGYGIMHLLGSVAVQSQRDENQAIKQASSGDSLQEASKLLNVSVETVKHDDAQNIRGGAAVLAAYAKKAHNSLPTSIDDWYTAVAQYSGMNNSQAEAFADTVYKTMQQGTSLTTTDGQVLSIAKTATNPHKVGRGGMQLFSSQAATTQAAECPSDIDCRFVPARYAQNSDDPTDYGNMDIAERPKDMNIKYIIIHDTEGSYESSISWFQDPQSYVSAHYLIRSSDGQVTQMVKDKDVAWHAGNWYTNMHSIGIEHEGFAADGGSWYTEAMYQSSAKLVKYLAKKYNIPLDREHIIGHEQFAGITPSKNAAMHTDPGPYWDWQHYMELLGKPAKPTAPRDSAVVTITPGFAKNKQPVTNCAANGTCTTLPTQGTNFVYLRTEPRDNAPLISDSAVHPDGAPGTTRVDDTTAKAVYGQQFAVAERQGFWTAIWFGGRKAWFYEPSRSNPALTITTPTQAQTVSPKPGKASIAVYGRPTPEASAFKPGTTPLTVTPLQYTIAAGQKYVAYDTSAPNDYYQVLTFDRSAVGDGTMTIGTEKYIPIAYGHRQAYVKASDVIVN